MKLAIALLLAFAPFLAAQSGNPPRATGKWEYCVVTGGSSTLSGAQVRLTASVRYATEKGFRDEEIELLVDNPGGRNRDYSWRISEATAKALAQLGGAGWELVSALPRPGQEQSLYSHTLYLKRRLP